MAPYWCRIEPAQIISITNQPPTSRSVPRRSSTGVVELGPPRRATRLNATPERVKNSTDARPLGAFSSHEPSGLGSSFEPTHTCTVVMPNIANPRAMSTPTTRPSDRAVIAAGTAASGGGISTEVMAPNQSRSG